MEVPKLIAFARGRIEAYLGDVELASKRVIDVGAPSGALSFFMKSTWRTALRSGHCRHSSLGHVSPLLAFERQWSNPTH